MGFQLVIAEGKEAGKEFVFDQTSVLIGRTSECDVVLYDPGVSRKHARIYAEGDRYFVEDMGSSNGTKVNGSIVKRKELNDGDSVALGPVVFNFSSTWEEDRGTEPGHDVAEQSTRIVSAADIKRMKNKGVAMVPAGATEEQLKALGRSATRAMAAVKPRSGPKNAIARPGTPPGGSAMARPRGGVPLTAAEKARIRRESSALVANWRIFWAEASLLTRRLIFGAGGLVALGLLAFVYYLIAVPADRGPKPPPEPDVLTRKPIEESFGLGDGVTYERPDKKIFTFDYVAPVRAVVILHFQSRDISQGEVTVSVNGADVGELPPDTLASNEKAHELILPPTRLKKGEVNTVMFDNVRNPPKSDPWRIWNVWIEINLLPELPVEELVRQAKQTYDRGIVTFERRHVGAGNRYEAWKDFRTTWLMLEAHPEPKPELYHLAKEKVKEAQQELDRTCAQLLLEAHKQYLLKNFEAARSELDHVKDFFPANDQPCPWRAEQKRYEWDL